MATLDDAIATVLLHEGGYSNDPRDPGAATNFGISLRFLQSLTEAQIDELNNAGLNFSQPIDVAQVQALTKPKARIIYDLFFWQPYNYSEITDIDIATKVFDVGVDMGSENANKCLQRAVRSVSGVVLTDDGVLGPLSISTINKTDSEILYAALKSELAGRYRLIAGLKPSMNYALLGWLNRAYSQRVAS